MKHAGWKGRQDSLRHRPKSTSLPVPRLSPPLSSPRSPYPLSPLSTRYLSLGPDLSPLRLPSLSHRCRSGHAPGPARRSPSSSSRARRRGPYRTGTRAGRESGRLGGSQARRRGGSDAPVAGSRPATPVTHCSPAGRADRVAHSHAPERSVTPPASPPREGRGWGGPTPEGERHPPKHPLAPTRGRGPGWERCRKCSLPKSRLTFDPTESHRKRAPVLLRPCGDLGTNTLRPLHQP